VSDEIQFASHSYRHDSLPVSAQRCVNAYAEKQPRDAKAPIPVFGAPGISEFITVGRGPIRGLHEMNGIGYTVSRNEFYSFDADGNQQLLGAGITGISPVSIDGNGTQVAITNGTNGFIYNSSTATFSQISDPDFNEANTVAFIDGYFAYDWKGFNKFFLSDLLDGTTYPALSFASAESKPDRVLATWSRDGLLLIFGEKTIEPWDHTGASNFPFQRIKGATVDRGVIAPLAICSEDTAKFFLGNDRVFYRMDGLRPLRISTHAIERHWETFSTIDDAFCFTVSFGGHKFIYVVFPTAGETWGCDIATDYRWHERQSYDDRGEEIRWRANCAVSAFNKYQLIGDANSGRIGKIDPTVYTEFGDPIVMSLTSPPLHGGGKLVFMPEFYLDMEMGVGLATGQGSDPQVMLDMSDDGGETFSYPQQWRTLGAIGDRMQRLRWTSLGSFYQRVLRVTVSDNVKKVVIAARTPGINTGVG